MPIYDFRCRACGHGFEALVRHGAEPPCPACGATGAERAVAAPAAPGRSRRLLQAARAQAAREGHLSHSTAAERRAALRGGSA